MCSHARKSAQDLEHSRRTDLRGKRIASIAKNVRPRRWNGAGDRLLRPSGRNWYRRCRRAGCHAYCRPAVIDYDGTHNYDTSSYPADPSGPSPPSWGTYPSGGLVAPVLLALNLSIQQSIRSISRSTRGVSAGTKTTVASRFDLPQGGSAWRTGLPGGAGSSRSAARPRSVLPPESPRRSTSDREPLWHRRWPSLLTGRCAPVPGSDRVPERRLRCAAWRCPRGPGSAESLPWNDVQR